MIILFGTGFYGKVANYQDQWIETKFFSVMFIPIFPTSSMYVTSSGFKSREGVLIDMNNKSVIATYARLFTAFIALFSAYIAVANGSRLYLTNKDFHVTIFCAVISTLLWIYFFFFYGSTKKADIPLRDKVGSITGLYALPHWFDHFFLHARLEYFEKIYRQLYPDNDWKIDVMADYVAPEKIQLLYSISLFNYILNSSNDYDTFYIKADSLYQL